MSFSLFRGLGLALFCCSSLVHADQINVNVYSGFQDIGGGGPFTGFVGNLSTPDIQFGTDTNFQWAPFGLAFFGADLTGTLDAASTGYYRLAMTSDDGSELFIDGTEAINNGGTHGPGLAFTDILLTQGLHPFEIQYFQGVCCQAGLDLTLANGLTYSDAPEPGSLPLLLIALALSGMCILHKGLLCTILHKLHIRLPLLKLPNVA